jgi:hypothetical protein
MDVAFKNILKCSLFIWPQIIKAAAFVYFIFGLSCPPPCIFIVWRDLAM